MDETEAEKELCAPDAKKLKLDTVKDVPGKEGTENKSETTQEREEYVQVTKHSENKSEKSVESEANVQNPKAEKTADGSVGQGPALAQREIDVGITQYISSLPGFFGVLKQR